MGTTHLYRFLHDGRWGYFDSDLRVRISPRFAAAEQFNEGRACVRVARGEPWSFIDDDGVVVLPVCSWQRCRFVGGRARIRLDDDSWCFVDHAGLRTSATSYKYMFDYGEGGLAPAMSADERWGFVDWDGSWVCPPRYEWAYPFSDALAAVEVGGLCGYIDQAFNVVIPPQFMYACPFSEGLAATRHYDRRWGFMKHDGRCVIDCQYDDAKGFSESLAGVQVDGRWGFVEPTGEMAIAPRFDVVWDFRGGLAEVEVEACAGRCYIDTSGRLVWESQDR